ncbi:flagellin [Thiocystis violascens]|uniref:Flagellin n=1 Tax=Thiocystis violascens (strain ATCC 17096 / DSM 198 / 6111) TaxID=765911 RepID=I3YDF9_THIV6|nr:flagellin [Thiocystis violascens]AFL75027.1 flagellin/flagellar hook associated protein [Thiocystis violascens DSM 198]
MVGINNQMALGAQSLLNRSQGALETTQERLASGKRVNGAADDATGLALISQFAAQLTGDAQGVRNLSDGISMMQTAEAGVSQISENLQRIGDLSLQSMNGTLSDSDRANLQTEVSALREQIAQTIEGTSFNGVKLLPREGELGIQASARANDAMIVNTRDLQEQMKTFGLDDIDLSTAAGAASALKTTDQITDYLSGIQGEFGAAQNRFEASIRALKQGNVNVAAAQSGIQDTDYARATAEQSRNLILSQANIAMLSQANNISSLFVSQLLA